MYSISSHIKSKTIHKGIALYNVAYLSYGVVFDFEVDELKKLMDNIYDIYEHHNDIHKYEKDIETFLSHAIKTSIKNEKRKITISDILDSIWEVKTSDNPTTSFVESSSETAKIATYKIRKSGEVL